MTDNVYRITRPAYTPTTDELLARIRELAADTLNLRFDHPHTKERLSGRTVSIRLALEVIRLGEPVRGPTLDKWGDWRLKLRRMVAGRRVQVVVAVKEDHLVVVTVI